MAEYQASEGLSKHTLDHFHTAPAYMKFKQSKEFKPSRAMELGTVVHDLVLENKQTFAVAPACDRRTKEGKATWQEFCEQNVGLLIVTEEENAQITGAADSARRLLEKIQYASDDCEVSLYWERDGVQCRGRLDLMGEFNDENVIVDLKTVTRISNFDRSFFDLRYDVQAEWYRFGAQQVFGLTPSFIFLAVDMEPPHLAQYVFPSTEVLIGAANAIDEDLMNYKLCKELDTWPGLPETRIIMPRYV